MLGGAVGFDLHPLKSSGTNRDITKERWMTPSLIIGDALSSTIS